MKGDPKVIEFLNGVLKGELTAVSQYWLHYRLLEDLGISRLAEYERHESIDEMKHADALMERIFFLEGLPAMQQLNRLRIGENVPEILQADLDLEHDAVALLRDAVEYADSIRDYPSRDLFASILRSEEEHIDFIETQQSMIEQMGLANYLQLQSKPAES
ncbi:MAG: bacterioferritin [Polymorphobacter sp.]|uniref:bacterioferritin n=1 Tax=Polymorphobacter sp. TaxID=1909290 RepID=UPI003A8B6BE6